jgi:hypothetical protein
MLGCAASRQLVQLANTAGDAHAEGDGGTVASHQNAAARPNYPHVALLAVALKTTFTTESTPFNNLMVWGLNNKAKWVCCDAMYFERVT